MIHRGIVQPHTYQKPSQGPPRLPIREPIMPALFNFPDPAPTSSCAVEQEMLDHGTLTQEDIDIQTYGSLLLNLGPNFCTPEALMDMVNYYLTCNALTSAGAKPLTSYVAHTPPKDPERHRLENELEKVAENLNRQDTMEDMNNTNDINQEIPCEGDEDISFESNDDQEAEEELDEENLVSFATQNDPLDSSPDPFEPPSNLFRDHDNWSQSTFSTTLPPHLLIIYVTVTWLHLQWHLPHAACNALLAIMACLLVILSPQLKVPFVTLQSAMKAL